MTLDQLKPGCSGTISVVGGEGALRRRLLDMGLTPKTKVTVRKVAPMGDPIELFLRSYVLTIRKDDAPETVKARLKTFHEETEPLKDFYKKLGNLKLVEGNQPIENATRDILAALGE